MSASRLPIGNKKPRGARSGIGGYGWNRTTDLGIMSLAL